MTQHKLIEKSEIIKAYTFAESNSLISKIHELKKEMFFKKIDIYYKCFSSYIYSTNHDNVEYNLSQLLNILFLNNEFNKKLLLSLYNNKIFSHPLPSEYISILKSNNIKINRTLSTLRFISIIIKYFASGLFNNLVLLKKIFFENKPILSSNKFVFFPDISESCIPLENGNNKYNVINWYILNKLNTKILEIRHNIKSKNYFNKNGIVIKSENHPADYLQTTSQKSKFLLWSIHSFLYNIFCLLTFRFTNVLVYAQACNAKVYELTNKEYLPVEIYFSISNFSFKPLWTYVAEGKNIKVVNYSYASSFQGFKIKTGYIDQEYLFLNTKWKFIYLWSKDYYEYVISRTPKNVNIELVNPIFYSDSNYNVETSIKNYIGVFDVTPMNEDISCTYLPELRYRSTENSILFLNHIYDAAMTNNYILLWKRKRKFHAIHSKEYIDFCHEFEKRKNVVLVDSDASAFKVIQFCKVCISMPFTSTALIAKYYNIKSIYYDPTSLLYPDDRGAQGIELVQNKNNLLNYFKYV